MEKLSVVSMAQIDFDKELGQSIFEVYDENDKALKSGTYDECIVFISKNNMTLEEVHKSDHN